MMCCAAPAPTTASLGWRAMTRFTAGMVRTYWTAGDDFIFGGATAADLRDVIYGGATVDSYTLTAANLGAQISVRLSYTGFE